MATSDLHAQVWPHDYDVDAPTTGVGLARLATVIRAARAGARNSLLFDNGDLFQGSQLADDAADDPDAPHPMALAMAKLGYDAATLGNHDFNYGLDRLERWIGGLPHPLTLCNIVRRRGGEADDRPLAAPYLLLDRDIVCDDGSVRRLRVGVIGAAPPQTLLWDHALLSGRLEAHGIHESIAAQLPRLRAEGADLIVALCHSGVGALPPDAGAEDAALSVATLDGVDVVVAGHTHRRLPGADHGGLPGVDPDLGRLAGKPAVMPGAFGSDLALVDLALVADGGRWRVRSSECCLLPCGDAAPDPLLLAAVRPAHLRTRRAARRPQGHLSAPMHALFPHVCHSPALQFAADAQSWEAARLLDGRPEAALPLLSAIAPFKGGTAERASAFVDIPAGPLRRGHLAELAPFPNSLCVIAVTGAQLRLWLERGASGFAQVPDGSEAAPLLREGAASYNFEQIHGLRYRIDLSRKGWFDAAGGPTDRDPATARVVTLTAEDGRPLADGDRFVAATNTYRAAGGGGYGFLAECPRLATSPHPLRDTLSAFVAAEPRQPAPLRRFWGFAPVAATVEVVSAPWADIALHGDGARSLKPDGLSENGGRRFLLDLSSSDLPEFGQSGAQTPNS